MSLFWVLKMVSAREKVGVIELVREKLLTVAYAKFVAFAILYSGLILKINFTIVVNLLILSPKIVYLQMS